MHSSFLATRHVAGLKMRWCCWRCHYIHYCDISLLYTRQKRACPGLLHPRMCLPIRRKHPGIILRLAPLCQPKKIGRCVLERVRVRLASESIANDAKWQIHAHISKREKPAHQWPSAVVGSQAEPCYHNPIPHETRNHQMHSISTEAKGQSP